jgi:hypothetical protein
MKVTKLIREHVEDKIEELYRPAFNKVENEINSLNHQIDKAKGDLKVKTEKVLLDFFKKEGMVCCGSSYSSNDCYSLYLYVGPKDMVENLNNLKLKKQELKMKRDNTIMSILLELELGGTKETLDKLLEKAVLDFNN